jgi:hypothetical protein
MRPLITALLVLAGCADHHPEGTKLADAAPKETTAVVSPVVAPRGVAAVVDTDSVQVVAVDSNPEKRPVLRRPDQLAMLPRLIRDTLTARGCRVPGLPGDASRNVLHGNFFGAGNDSWAIWCVDADGESPRILVFRDANASAIDEVESTGTGNGVHITAYDSTAAGGQYYGCMGGIGRFAVDKDWAADVITDDDVPLSDDEKKTPPHDGILDADCEGASNIHYFTGKRWVLKPGGN